MAALSFQVNLAELATGQGLEAVVTGTNAPAGGSGFVEVRIDTTAGVITDGNVTGGTRGLKREEALQLLNYLTQYILRCPLNSGDASFPYG
jgi:hypothetical protein